MKTELFISLRYLFTKRKEKFLSLISIISILGVAIGVMALIVVLAVMSGFDDELREKIVGNSSHITVSNIRGIEYKEYAAMAGKLSANPHVTGVSPYVEGQVLAKEGQRFFAVGIRGIEPDKEITTTKIKDYIKQGSIDNLKSNTVIIGRELAAYLGVGLNDTLETHSAAGKQYSLKVVGVFNSGMYDYDLHLIFTDLKTAQLILGMEGLLSSVAVKLDNMYLADKLKKEVAKALGYEYFYRTWAETNQNFFAALKLEKVTMFVILTLIVLVASFNIASTLIVMVVEKTKDIGILKAIGMTARSVRNIFTMEGLIIGMSGTLMGIAGGIGLCFLLAKYQFVKLPQDIYSLDKIPVSLRLWPDMVLIIMAAVFISFASTIYPAIKAAQFMPVEALRYE